MTGVFGAGLDGVTFESKGCKLLGGFYRASGIGPRPTAILLHGLPGTEKNLDIAYELRSLGWNCLYFHYRGSWGSEGDFSLDGRRDDLRAATAWIERQACADAARLALVGHSAGGYLALMEAALDARYKAAIALCPLVSPLRAPLDAETFEGFADMLHGVNGPDLRSQYDALPPVESTVERLRGRPVLLLTGGLDDAFPRSHYPPLMEVAPWIEWHEYETGDHFLSLCRKEAVGTATSWLTSHLGR